MDNAIAFVLEVDKLKGVLRKVKPLGLDRYENPAEHSWQLALFAMAMAPHAEPGTNIEHVITMLLVHDIGEIDTGDTMAFVEGGWEERKAAELKAVERILGLLGGPEADRMRALWVEFEAGETRESRYANALDRAMPALLNLANNGQSWRENGISHERVVKRLRDQIRDGCPTLWTYLEAKLAEAKAKGLFGA